MRAGGVAGRADEADRLARREGRAGDDVGIEHRQVAVRPDLAVEGLERQADAAARIGHVSTSGRRPSRRARRAASPSAPRCRRRDSRDGCARRRRRRGRRRPGRRSRGVRRRRRAAARRPGRTTADADCLLRAGELLLPAASACWSRAIRAFAASRVLGRVTRRAARARAGRRGAPPSQRAPASASTTRDSRRATFCAADDELAPCARRRGAPRRGSAACRSRESANAAVAAVEVGEREHLVDVPVGMVVGEDAAIEIGRAAGGGEVAGGGEDRVGRVPRIGDAVAVRVDAPAEPGARHELHPADRAGRARAHVAAEVRLDLVDRARAPATGSRTPRRPAARARGAADSESCSGTAGGVESEAGHGERRVRRRGAGSANGAGGTTAKVSARAVPASNGDASRSASSARRRIALARRDDAEAGASFRLDRLQRRRRHGLGLERLCCSTAVGCVGGVGRRACA